MGYVKVEDQWIYRESQIGTSDTTKDEPKENWTHSNVPEQEYTLVDEPSTSFHATNKTTDNTPTFPILSHDTLTKIIDSVVSIVKEEPLKKIISITLTEVIQSEVFKDTLLTAI